MNQNQEQRKSKVWYKYKKMHVFRFLYIWIGNKGPRGYNITDKQQLKQAIQNQTSPEIMY